MGRWYRLLVLCSSLLAGAASTAAAQPSGAGPIPAEAFFKPAKLERAALSPSGRWVAFVTGAPNGRNVLVTFDVGTWKPLAAVAYYDNADIARFQWVNDAKLVYSLVDRQRGGAAQVEGAGLFSVGRDGSEPRALVYRGRPRASDRRAGREPLAYNHRLLAVPRGNGDEVIVGEIRYDQEDRFKELLAKRLHVGTGAVGNLAAGTPPGVWAWWFDGDGRPRLILTRQKGVDALHWHGAGADAGWQLLQSYSSLAPPYEPLQVDGEVGVLASAHDDDGFGQLLQLQPGPDGLRTTRLVSTPGFDFDGRGVFDPESGRLLGYRVLTDGETTVWKDPAMAALQKEADARWPAHTVRLNCVRCTEPDRTVLARIWSDSDPGSYWIHSAADRRWRQLGEVRPEIDPKRMGRTGFHRIRARDGLELPVWITRPAGADGTARAAVVLVHGGPWVRGRAWAWSDEAQFLASRGYVVIEPEYRGSTGYGLKWYRAGWKQWGRAMQDDLADAVGWAVQKSWVDPKRVCIAGASYGGYAVLMSLIRHPDLYRCGAAWLAVTDPRQLMAWQRDSDMHQEYRDHHLPTLIGDPATEAAMLDEATPALHADKIRAPLLLAYGGGDSRVPPAHGTQLREALDKAGRPPEWIWYADEAHGWFKLESQVDFANRLESFLARHLQ